MQRHFRRTAASTDDDGIDHNDDENDSADNNNNNKNTNIARRPGTTTATTQPSTPFTSPPLSSAGAFDQDDGGHTMTMFEGEGDGALQRDQLRPRDHTEGRGDHLRRSTSTTSRGTSDSRDWPWTTGHFGVAMWNAGESGERRGTNAQTARPRPLHGLVAATARHGSDARRARHDGGGDGAHAWARGAPSRPSEGTTQPCSRGCARHVAPRATGRRHDGPGSDSQSHVGREDAPPRSTTPLRRST